MDRANDVRALARRLGWDAGQWDIDFAPSDLSRYSARILGKAKPADKRQVCQLLQACDELRIPVYPYSKGANWAFGGTVPFSDGCLLVDLSALDQVEEYDDEFGVVVVQPGVSQGDLCRFLEQRRARYFLDVTGSGAETSVLGNALERGIAYNSLRADRIVFLEVALPDGQVIRTGFASRPDCKVRNLYPYGVGPDSRGLFLQSSFGIVLSMGYQLHPVQSDHLTFQVELPESAVPTLVGAIADLRRQQVLDCIVHIADPVRFRSTLSPILGEIQGLSPADRDFWLKRLGGADSPWSALGSISGPRALVAAKKSELKRRLRGIGRLRFFRESRIQALLPWLGWGPLKRLQTFLMATTPLRGFARGKASSDAVKMAFWSPKGERLPEYSQPGRLALDKSQGVIFCVPLAPLDASGAQGLISVARSFAKETGAILGVTLNTLSNNVLEAVVSLHFDPVPDGETERAHQAFLQLNERYMARGYYPYRLNPALAPMAGQLTAHPSFTAALKKAIDPTGVVSPGHYL